MSKDNKSEEFIVTARKWRPLQFKDVVGQSHITLTLQNAIRLKRIHHAYLFSGPRGVGKTTTARIIAKAVNCLNPQDSEPCNECENCLAVINGRSMDIIEIDGASNNSVDDIRQLRENAKYPPVNGKYKMYIIDEVHMLSNAAFNALLKTLEEPPPHLMFVFATTESHKVPATILSRCQRYEFRRMEIEDTVNQLKYIASREEIEIDEDSLLTIAKKADGSMRDSQSIFDQVVAFCGKKVVYSEMADALHLIDLDFYFRVSNAVKEHDVAEMFQITRDVLTKGYDFQETLSGMLEHLRNILTVKVTGKTDLIDSSEQYLNMYKTESERFLKSDLLRLMNIVNSGEQALRFAPQPRVRFELTLITMASMESSLEIKQLIDEIRGNSLPDGEAGASAISQPEKKIEPAEKPAPVKISEPVKQVEKPEPEQSQTVPEPETAPAPVQPETKITEPEPDYNAGAETPTTGNKLREGWKGFTDKYANADNGLHIIKQTSMVQPKFVGNEVILTTNVEFLYDGLKKNRQQLLEYMKEYFGPEVDIKLIMGELDESYEIVEEAPPETTEETTEPEAPAQPETQPEQTGISTENKENDIKSSNNEPGTVASSEGKHPVEKEIIILFKAKEIPNSKF